MSFEKNILLSGFILKPDNPITQKTVNNNPINKEIFLKLLSYLLDNYEFLHETNTLDINTQYIKHNKKGLGNVRCSVKGVDSIKKLCKNNELTDFLDTEYIQKSYYVSPKNISERFEPIRDTNYNYRINIKSEKNLEKVCIQTVESGAMTKDLAILINKKQKYLTTKQFLEKIDSNLKKNLY